MHICISILGLVLGEKVEVFAQRAGELRHFFAAMVGSARSVTLSLLNTPVDLETEKEEDRKITVTFYSVNAVYESTGHFLFTCTMISARCVSLAWRRSAVLSSWINQDPLLVFRMAAVP